MLRVTRWFVSLAVVALFATGSAQAQTRPFKVRGSGVVDFVPVTPNTPATHDATGVGTFLGAYTGIGRVQLLQFTGPTTADFNSYEPFVFTAANGDNLAFDYGRGPAGPGEVNLFPADGGMFIAVWLAEFTPVPALCTGRFASVNGGSFMMLAITEPFVLGGTDPVAYSWSGEGTLSFAKP